VASESAHDEFVTRTSSLTGSYKGWKPLRESWFDDALHPFEHRIFSTKTAQSWWQSATMPILHLVDFNIVTAVMGGFILLFGLVSYLVKERFYLSEALISLLAGVVFSPHATNWIRPLDYALGSEDNLDYIMLYFTRLVLGVQLVIAGIQLPHRYLWTEWKSLSLLLGPGMCAMWMCASLLVWAMVPNISILQALATGACVTPTDPVLSNSIVKGRFADKNIPRPLQRIIIAESGANDGLGYPFLFLALYLIKYSKGGVGGDGGAGRAMEQWFVETWVYSRFFDGPRFV
jgi:sodium/hydrogen antiporter